MPISGTCTSVGDRLHKAAGCELNRSLSLDDPCPVGCKKMFWLSPFALDTNPVTNDLPLEGLLEMIVLYFVCD